MTRRCIELKSRHLEVDFKLSWRAECKMVTICKPKTAQGHNFLGIRAMKLKVSTLYPKFYVVSEIFFSFSPALFSAGGCRNFGRFFFFDPNVRSKISLFGPQIGHFCVKNISDDPRNFFDSFYRQNYFEVRDLY